ncbi:hypothetical protein E1281_01130 [Actinomadura sp. KC345]|uniref:hypothetical protein n=1 Tax=Actinomadura sp. KC345 TaxID=2530371 RepID=UPI0010487624|nr:hypothetical protein [Actinomadura sp. KC345]TDC58583.1 hypothetical protein E1281_01130 [Actinomadura sp. KC345]
MTVTIPTFDYDAMYATEPTVWRERGLHWHCYSWRGTGRDWADDKMRADDQAEITPSAVRAWLRKNPRLIRATFSTPEDAAAWSLEQWSKARAEALTPVPEWVTDANQEAMTVYDLRCGTDVSKGLWVKGPSMVSWSVVGTSDRCH